MASILIGEIVLSSVLLDQWFIPKSKLGSPLVDFSWYPSMSLSNPGEGNWDMLGAALVSVKLRIVFGEDSSIELSRKKNTCIIYTST